MTTERRAILLAGLVFLTACASPAPPTLRASATAPALTIDVRYPKADSELEMGQDLRVIIIVRAADRPVNDATLDLEVRDPAGDPVGNLQAEGDRQGTYRNSAGWMVPHRSLPGDWSLEVRARSPEGEGTAVVTFRVRTSTSEDLLERYGFWIDAPTLRGISPSLVGEFGDAQNGRIMWGGSIPAQHVLPAAWIEIQWRRGRAPIETEEDVRRFFLDDLGQFGFTPIRALGPFTPFQFHQWPAWRVGARGEFRQDQVEWIVFYAPEMDRTYAIGTTVVLPPAGIDAPAALRDSFAVFPALHAAGVAPAPLPHLLPAPDDLDPPLGQAYMGPRPISLSWSWDRPLAVDEYFDVTIDYNYAEGNPFLHLTTRQTQIALPPDLYDTPNCGVFNWQVRVMRPAAAAAGSRPEQAVSYPSFYRYVLWSHPIDRPASFPPRCPNAQY